MILRRSKVLATHRARHVDLLPNVLNTFAASAPFPVFSTHDEPELLQLLQHLSAQLQIMRARVPPQL